MSLKIAVLGTGDSNVQETSIPDAIRDVASSDIEPVLLPVPGSVFPSTPAAREKAVQAYLAAGIAAEKAGYDAVYVNTVGDYGLEELRQSIKIPVVGSGSAAIRAATLISPKYSIVTLWPPAMKFIYEHVLGAADVERTPRKIHFMSEDNDLATMGQDDNLITGMQACQYVPMQTVKKVCHDALKDDGVDTIMLGCTCMADMKPILEKDGLPVIEPMREGYKMAEELLRLSL